MRAASSENRAEPLKCGLSLSKPVSAPFDELRPHKTCSGCIEGQVVVWIPRMCSTSPGIAASIAARVS